MEDLTLDVNAGQAIYTKRLLRHDDWWVPGVSNRVIWRCPTYRIRQHYQRHLSNNHLGFGVSTGCVLDRCEFLDQRRMVLSDPNQNCLRATLLRVNRYQSQAVCADVLQPYRFDGGSFCSIGLNYVLHCIPGTMVAKSVIYDHLSTWLETRGIVFGATILGKQHEGHNLLAHSLIDVYNRKDIFSDLDDALDTLGENLQSRFADWGTHVYSSVALFWGKMS